MTVSSEKRVTSGVSNCPVSFVTAFNGDELALIFGTYLSDAVFLLEWERGCVVAANARFLSLLTSTTSSQEGYRDVYIRVKNLSPEATEATKQEMGGDYEIIYVIREGD